LKTGRHLAAATAFAAAFACAQAIAAGGGFVDVLRQPAEPSALASKALLQSVAKTGRRLVAVGQRGHVIFSDDAGGAWTQAKVPVSSDLTAVWFADAKHGWAVGHDGVILASEDAGETWTLQLTGDSAAVQGADKAFLDVWFADERNGYAVGAFNLVVHTSDGGATWESWSGRTDNPKQYNLHAIRPVGGSLFIAGEAGLLLRLDPRSQRFSAIATPYNGSFFGIADAGGAPLLFGLRGNAFLSTDGGATWAKVDARLPSSIVATAQSANGRLLLADASGRIAASQDGGRTFSPLTTQPSLPITGLAEVGNGLIATVGPRGATVERMLAR